MGSTWLALRADLRVRWRAMAGRWAWVLFAGSAGVAPTADIPVALVLAAIPVTLLLAIVIAAGPGWAAARVRPASVLRAE